jgi:GT2 family glycosyltransferase
MVMESIPVLGTAVVNAPHWVYRLFYSIDYPVDNFVVFNNNGRDQITYELDLLTKVPHKYVKNVKICHLPANLGCSGAWNLIIKSFINAPYWIITNHDLMYTPGLLKNMVAKAQDAETGLVHGKNGSWDLFLLKDWVVQNFGLFDENLYPAYCEDMDYGMRFKHVELKRDMNVEVPYYHGESEGYEDGSQTWRSEPALANGIHLAHELNKHYLHAKWSPAWQAHVEGEVYKTPFDMKELPLDFTTYDLEFVRKKYLGF